MAVDVGEESYDFIKSIDSSENMLPLSDLALKYIIHKDGVPASWEDHGYLIDIMNDLHPRQCVEKSAQIGCPLDINTPIPTPDGWKKMEDIQICDKVFNEDGVVSHVMYVSPVFYDRKCYEITFSDRSTIVCDQEHLWTLNNSNGSGTGSDVTITTEEISATYKAVTKIRNRYALNVTKALILPKKDLPLDPYVLGLWLGDGHSAGFRITAHMNDSKEYSKTFKERGHDFVIRVNDKKLPHIHCIAIGGQGHGFGIRGGVLTFLNVKNNKHIPQEYLRASYEQRLELLQGLMDSDGTVDNNGSCSFSNCNKRLIDNVYELLMTLGIKARINDKKLSKTGYSGNPRKTPTRTIYEILFRVYSETPVFKLPRKLIRIPNRDGRRTTETERRRIINVVEVPSVPVRCIAVDTSTHLYLAGKSMLATHNSTAFDWKALMLAKRYGSRIALQISFPTAHKAEEHSQTRFNPVVNNSPELARLILVTDQSKTQKQVFAARIKVINGCTIHFFGRTGEKQVISVDTNVVFIDERDFDKRDDKIAMLEARTGHDFVFRTEHTKGIIVHYSTPSMPGFGIDKVFQNSDQRFFFITCTRCHHEFVNKFDEDCVSGFYAKGETKYEGEIYWRCPKCRRRLDLAVIGDWKRSDPLEVTNCKWIATKPENSKGNEGWHGRHIGKADCAFRWVSPKELLIRRDDPETWGRRENLFFNFDLGLPHMGSNVTVSTEVLEQKNIRPDLVKWKKTANNTIIGCDQGCWLAVAEKIYNSESESFPQGRYGIIHLEHIHEDIAFDTVLGKDEAREGLLSQRIREFGASLVVIDDMPNTAMSKRLAQKFNDGFYKRHGTTIWRLISSKTSQTKDYLYEEEEHTVSENRTKSLDELFESLSNIEILFPQKGLLSQTLDTTFYKNETWDMLDLLFDHLKKETKISRLPDHLDPEQNATVMRGGKYGFGNYLTIGNGQNHLLHALKMLRMCIDIKKHFGVPEIILPFMPAKEFYMGNK